MVQKWFLPFQESPGDQGIGMDEDRCQILSYTIQLPKVIGLSGSIFSLDIMMVNVRFIGEREF